MKTILGIDQIGKHRELFQDKQIGLITNYSGVTSNWENNIDLFVREGYKIVKLFTPEHGLYGASDGTTIEDSIYPRYQIPIISLYGDKKKPEKDDLKGIDILVYDIQDVGLRYYTFIYTMAYCIEAAAEVGIPFVVLDRPNPLGGEIVSGACIKPELSSFVGDYELPVRYGLTCGELGKYFIEYKKLNIDYKVITMKNYNRKMTYPDTGLIWNVPSPALGGYKNTVCYCGGCFVEATNISEGRGTPKPFQMYGAPFIDMDRLYDMVMRIIKDQPVACRKRTFVPFTGKHEGRVCFGVELEPLTDNIDFIPISLQLIKVMKELAPEQFQFRTEQEENHLCALTGDTLGLEYIEGKKSLDEVLAIWDKQAKHFKEKSTAYYLYS